MSKTFERGGYKNFGVRLVLVVTIACSTAFRVSGIDQEGSEYVRAADVDPERKNVRAHHFKKLALELNNLIVREAAEWWDAQRYVA